METTTLENLPAAQHALELVSFANLGTAQQDMLFNVTPGGSHAARLNPLDTYTNDLGYEQKRAIGPAKSLRVKAGDVVEMEVYARYQVPASNSTFVTGLAGLVSGSLSFVSAGETATAFHAINNLLAGGSLVPNNGDNVPKAYLQYLLFDDNFEPLVGNDCNCYTRVTSDANNAFEKLVLLVEIQEDGYLYTYVANESTENINVWFDDFTVTHLGLDVLQSTSYYPFGGLAENVQKEKYRFGYQGQFAEKDEETGFNHFELRDFDSKIGRWMAVDPMRQYWSPYVGMGNSPVYLIDPTGGCAEDDLPCWEAAYDAGFTSDADGSAYQNLDGLGVNGRTWSLREELAMFDFGSIKGDFEFRVGLITSFNFFKLGGFEVDVLSTNVYSESSDSPITRIGPFTTLSTIQNATYTGFDVRNKFSGSATFVTKEYEQSQIIEYHNGIGSRDFEQTPLNKSNRRIETKTILEETELSIGAGLNANYKFTYKPLRLDLIKRF